MKHIKASGFIILLLLLPISTSFAAYTPSISNSQVSSVAEWTVMFYFDGDQLETTYSLSDKMLDDVANLESIGSTNDVNFVVLMDLDGYFDSSLHYVTKGESIELPLTLINNSWTNELNMGCGETLLDFMSWAIQTYPAEHYNVYLNNHGGGWIGICVDEVPEYDILDLSELKNAFSLIRGKIGRKIDVVSMDACLMSMVEVAYQLRDDVDYLIGSEAFIHTHEENGGLFLNWILDDIYGSLVANPSMTGEDLCVESVASFRADEAHVIPPIIVKPQAVDCISAVDVSKVEDVALAVDNMAQRLLERPLIYRLFLSRVFRRTQSFSGGFDFIGYSYYPYLDLYNLAWNIRHFIPDRELRNRADEVMNAVTEAVVVERHGDRKIRWEHTDAHGLSIYLPFRKLTYREGYETLDFSRDTSWYEFIQSCWLLRR